MTSLIPVLLPRLQSHRLPQFNAGAGSVYPYYDRQSLINLPASVCHWLGIPTFGAPALTDEILYAMGGPFRQVVLLVVDGLGLEQLNHFTAPDGAGPLSGGACWMKPSWRRSPASPLQPRRLP